MLTFDLQDLQQNPTPFFEAILRGELIQLNYKAKSLARVIPEVQPSENERLTNLKKAMVLMDKIRTENKKSIILEEILEWREEGRA